MKSLKLQFKKRSFATLRMTHFVILNEVKNLCGILRQKPQNDDWVIRMTRFGMAWIILFFAFYTFNFEFALASTSDGLVPPPIITLYNEDASNNEIFYIGGTTVVSEGDVIIYMQRSDGAALSYTVKADQNGEWFYSSSEFLRTGEYIIWTQVKSGEFSSPPSPQINIKVVPLAFEFICGLGGLENSPLFT